MEAHQLFGSLDNEREYAKQAVVAATFGYRCGPSRADDRARLRTAQFTAIFLYLDDTTQPELMSDSRWSVFHRALIAQLQSGVESPDHTALAAWLAELRGIAGGASAALADFNDSFLSYCLSLDDERRAVPAAMSESDFLNLRRRTIFVEPVLNQWRASMGINVGPSNPGRPFLLAAQGMARDLVILANDLGSLLRDSRAETSEKNLVLHWAQGAAGGLDAAARRAVAEYNTQVEALQHALAAADSSGVPFVAPLADLLTGLVDGNLDCMDLLAQRYVQQPSQSFLSLLRRLRY